MSLYVDTNLKTGNTPNTFMVFMAVIVAAISGGACLYNIASTTEMLNLALICFGALMGGGYFFGGIYQLVEGRRTVSMITFYSHNFAITDILHRKHPVDESSVEAIIEGNANWFIRPSIAFQNDRKSYTLKLKDGRFYRISPHMERIDELKEKLEAIIENNRLSKSHI